jgi:hypothetical protein
MVTKITHGLHATQTIDTQGVQCELIKRKGRITQKNLCRSWFQWRRQLGQHVISWMIKWTLKARACIRTLSHDRCSLCWETPCWPPQPRPQELPCCFSLRSLKRVLFSFLPFFFLKRKDRRTPLVVDYFSFTAPCPLPPPPYKRHR